MRLYRPVGMVELQRIYESGMTAFPPRLPEQPIFYPVLNFPYAEQIARDWNTKSNSFAGYVTRFDVDDQYVSQFERQIVGNRQHEELWVPAEQLEEFNRHIRDRIIVVAAYFGSQFVGYIPKQGVLKDRAAVEQFVALREIAAVNKTGVEYEIRTNSLAIFLHYPFWQQRDWSDQGIATAERDAFLIDIQQMWEQAYPDTPLPCMGKTRSSA